MYILGLSFGHHDSAATLIRDGQIIACAQEERFNRKKNCSDFPELSIKYCLEQAGITINEIDHLTYYEKPFLKFHRYLISQLLSWPFNFKHFFKSMPQWLSNRLTVGLTIKEKLGYEKEIYYCRHHLSHAASAYFVSDYDEAVVLISDGIGEWATLSWGIGKANKIEMKQEIHLPHSIGLLYSAITSYLGFEVNSGEGKVMGLADWGEPKYVKEFESFIKIFDDASFSLSTNIFNFFGGKRMFRKDLITLLGPERSKGEPIEQRHKDIAATLQFMTEKVLVNIAAQLYDKTKIKNICLAGGSFLNIPTNTKIIEQTPFENLYVQPAAGDAGGSLGSAYFLYNHLLDNPRVFSMNRADWGKSYSSDDCKNALSDLNLEFDEMNDIDLCKFTAKKIAQGDIVGWFQQRQEFGPRALGRRSILASCEVADMKDILNAKVKHRESFRPYGVSILKDHLESFYNASFSESPFMLKVANVREDQASKIPAALHINDTSRIHTVTKVDGLYFELLTELNNLTGIPLCINTSFNDNTEPIVLSPHDAIKCFLGTKMDYLILGNYVVRKN